MSIAKKLKFVDGKTLIVNMPDGFEGLFVPLPVVGKMVGTAKYGQALLFAKERRVLDTQLKSIVKRLESEAVFWIAYPKKSSSIKSDLGRNDFWDVLKGEGYAPVMQVGVDKDWSALRFKKTEAIGKMIRNTPMKERKVEGVDFEKRTVELPKDATVAIKKVKGLEAFFYSMSFSHKKEYVQAIVEAKKEETRKRRIDKMVEMVVALREKKEQKK